MTGRIAPARYHATVLEEPTQPPSPPTAELGAPSTETPAEDVDIAAIEGEFAQIDEALARLDAGDLDGAEAITDALVGPDLVIDLTDEHTPTDEGTQQVDADEVSTPITG